MAPRWFDIYAPLQEFHWKGDRLELFPGLWVKRFDQKPDLRGLDTTLGEDEQNNLFPQQHWLTFCWHAATDPSPGETVNLVLLTLWLVRATRTYVALRFELGQGGATALKKRVRLLSRFTWVPGTTSVDFEDADLQLVSSYYPVLHALCRARGRLNDALFLTLAGCWSHSWQVAIVCHAAAAETLLTYTSGPGITRRLSTSYACLVETQPSQRDAAFQEFRALYAARSDIVHGRTGSVPAANRLPTVARLEDVLRKLWRVVISSPPLVTALEGTDAQRKAYFLSVESGYTPPP